MIRISVDPGHETGIAIWYGNKVVKLFTVTAAAKNAKNQTDEEASAAEDMEFYLRVSDQWKDIWNQIQGQLAYYGADISEVAQEAFIKFIPKKKADSLRKLGFRSGFFAAEFTRRLLKQARFSMHCKDKMSKEDAKLLARSMGWPDCNEHEADAILIGDMAGFSGKQKFHED